MRAFVSITTATPASRCATLPLAPHARTDARADAHPRTSVLSFTVILIRVGSALDKTNRGFLLPTRSQPPLGSVARSRGKTQIHIRGVCHWAGEPKSRTSRRVAEPTRHRARKSQANNPASAASTPVAVPDAPRKFDVPPPPHSAFRLLVAHSHTHLAIRSGKSHRFFSTQVQPAQARWRGRRPREIRPPNHHRRSRTSRYLLPTAAAAARHCLVRGADRNLFYR